VTHISQEIETGGRSNRPRPSKLEALGLIIASVVLLGLMLVGLGAWLTQNRDFALDDAYITYIYSEHLAQGFGLRYNITDANPTEGSSSLLHLGLVAFGFVIGLDPLTFTRLLGVILFVLAPFAAMILVARVAWVPKSIALVCVVAANFVFIWMHETTGHFAKGMETILYFYTHCAVFGWALWFALKETSKEGLFNAIGLLLAIALILVRPEGLLLLGATGGMAVIARVYVRQGFQFVAAIKDILPVFLGVALFTAAYFAWKISYFGDIFPTAYWVKSNNLIYGTSGDILPGLKHVLTFLTFRWLPLAAVAFALLWTSGARQLSVVCALLVLPSLCIALLYAKAIHEVSGGFRYGFPLTSPLFIVGAFGLAFHARKRTTWKAPAVYLCTVSFAFLVSWSPYLPAARAFIDPVAATTGWVGHEPSLFGLAPIAEDLNRTGLEEEATLLTSAAGILKFSTGFDAIDWIGLNDEYLSGKNALSAQEVRNYIQERSPDVVMSIFPPAALGSTSFRDDPGFQSNSVQSTMAGRGVKLFRYWQRDKIGDVIYANMEWARDNGELLGCYELRQNWAVFVFVSKTSPHNATFKEAFRQSQEAECDVERVSRMYNYVPERVID